MPACCRAPSQRPPCPPSRAISGRVYLVSLNPGRFGWARNRSRRSSHAPTPHGAQAPEASVLPDRLLQESSLSSHCPLLASVKKSKPCHRAWPVPLTSVSRPGVCTACVTRPFLANRPTLLNSQVWLTLTRLVRLCCVRALTFRSAPGWSESQTKTAAADTPDGLWIQVIGLYILILFINFHRSTFK